MSTQTWYVGNLAGGHQKAVVQESTGKTIALVYDNDETADRIVRSVNTAPRLAEALRYMAEHWPAMRPDKPGADAYIKARAALAEWEAQ